MDDIPRTHEGKFLNYSGYILVITIKTSDKRTYWCNASLGRVFNHHLLSITEFWRFFLTYNFLYFFCVFLAIEAQIKELQTKRKEITAETEAQKGIGLLESGNYYDSELYETSGGKSSKYEGYVTSIAPNDDGDDDDDVGMPVQTNNGQAKRAFNPVAHAMKEIVQVSGTGDEHPIFSS